MIDLPQPPKQNSYYNNIAVKNAYQPIYDIINAQSKWVDATSELFNKTNNEMINNFKAFYGI